MIFAHKNNPLYCIIIMISQGYVCMHYIHVGIRDVILPLKLKKRGRPKGAEKIVIGLPAKKRKSSP